MKVAQVYADGETEGVAEAHVQEAYPAGFHAAELRSHVAPAAQPAFPAVWVGSALLTCAEAV